jgi:hypothetical protein
MSLTEVRRALEAEGYSLSRSSNNERLILSLPDTREAEAEEAIELLRGILEPLGVTGALNQTGQSDEDASTFATATEAESVMHHLATVLHNGGSAEFRIVKVTS